MARGGAAARGSPCGSSCRPWRLRRVGSRRGSCVCVRCVGASGRIQAPRTGDAASSSSTPPQAPPAQNPKTPGPATAPRVPQHCAAKRGRAEASEAGCHNTGLSHRARDARFPTPDERHEATRRGGVHDSRSPAAQSPARLAGRPARQRGAPMAARASSRQSEPAPPNSTPKPTRRGCASAWWGRRDAHPRREIARPSQREEVLNQHGRGGAHS